MAEPLEELYQTNKETILDVIPKIVNSIKASVHGAHTKLGLVSLRLNDGQIIYLHLIEKEEDKTLIRYAPNVSYLGEKDKSNIPQDNIQRISNRLRSLVN